MKKSLVSFFLSLISVCILIVACKPSTVEKITESPSKQENIYWSDIQWYLKNDIKINAIDSLYADTDYIIVDEKWFIKNILNQFNSFLDKNGVYFGDVNKNDCDNFSRAFSFFARVKSSQAGFMEHDLAIGEIYYKTFDLAHAINFAIVFDGNGNKKLLFIEPQGPSIISLTDEYKESFIQYLGL